MEVERVTCEECDGPGRTGLCPRWGAAEVRGGGGRLAPTPPPPPPSLLSSPAQQQRLPLSLLYLLLQNKFCWQEERPSVEEEVNQIVFLIELMTLFQLM